jgi:hypothetical protein
MEAGHLFWMDKMNSVPGIWCKKYIQMYVSGTEERLGGMCYFGA